MIELASDVSRIESLSEAELCPPALLSEQERAHERDIERLLWPHIGTFVAVSCPACGGRTADIAFEKFRFQYAKCAGCGTLYVTPRPSEDVLKEFYSNSEAYRLWADRIFPASEAARARKIHRPWFDRVLDACRRYNVGTARLVEVGPGFGTFASLTKASNLFESVSVVEPTPDLAAQCRARGLDVVEKPIEQAADEIAGTDVICSFEVIEHLFSPRTFLESCRRALNMNGLLVLSCPNGEGFDVAMLGSKSLTVDVEHLNLFNPTSLSALVESCGFTIREVTTPGRLDAEFVRDAILTGEFEPETPSFLRRVLIDEWERLGAPFQKFLADNGLSSHMWLIATAR